MDNLIRIEPVEAGVTAVILNRPQQRNALSIALLESLCMNVARLANEDAQRVIILRAEGSVFSAGLDLKEAADTSLVEQSARDVARTLRLLRDTPLISVAAVNGGAFAGGAGLVAACDIAIAAEDAQFGFPEARRGLLPALICEVLKPKVRDGDLRELFLTGEPVNAERAREIGLIHRVVSPSELFDHAVQLARSILEGGPETIRETKRLLNGLCAAAGKESTDALIHSHLAARQSEEAHEGMMAFAEKRLPKWSRKGRE